MGEFLFPDMEPSIIPEVDEDHPLRLPQSAVAGLPSWDGQKPLAVSWGMGVKSTAMLIGMYERGIRPDLILAADTGGEKPETYAYIETFGRWLLSVGFPEVIVVRRRDYPEDSKARGARTLEEYSVNTGALPSIAYGWKTCSDQWKRRPQDLFMAKLPEVQAVWEAGRKVWKAIGYDAAEPQRATNQQANDNKRYQFWYPLIEWDWCREECICAIERHGLPVPPKSACFFCPSSKKNEIFWLHEHHPELFARAVAMEHAAADYNETCKGLGRRFSWEGLVSLPLLDQAQLPDPPAPPCMCDDGGCDDE